jgi:hypothetical protein
MFSMSEETRNVWDRTGRRTHFTAMESSYKQSAEHSQEFFLANKVCLKSIEQLVFDLSGFKQITKQTKILKMLGISSGSRKLPKKLDKKFIYRNHR